MQAGHVIAPHLGTPVHEDLTVSPHAQRVKDSFAYKVHEKIMDMPDVGVNEKNIVFRKGQTELQGMVLSRPPNGGFSGTGPARVVVGASADGIDAQSRVYPTFVNGSERRMMVGPEKNGTTLTTAQNSVFRQHDGKTRQTHGSMSVVRAVSEAEAAEARRAAAYADIGIRKVDPAQGVSSLASVVPGVAALAEKDDAAAAPAPAVEPPIPYTPFVPIKPEPHAHHHPAVPSGIATKASVEETVMIAKNSIMDFISSKNTTMYILLGFAIVIAIIFFIVAMVYVKKSEGYRTRLKHLGSVAGLR